MYSWTGYPLWKAAMCLQILTGDVHLCKSSPPRTREPTHTFQITMAVLLVLSALNMPVHQSSCWHWLTVFWSLFVSIPTAVCCYCPFPQILVKDWDNAFTDKELKIICLENAIHDIFSGIFRCQWKACCSGKYRRKGHFNSCSFLFLNFHLKQCSGICI